MQKITVDYCSHKAAKYAVENWHYSESMPTGKKIMIGIWEDDNFTGAIIFSRGGNNRLFSPYGLDQTEGCELTRIAMRDHDIEVTYCMSRARKLLQEKCPGLKMIISFADKAQNHEGTIYQADNWFYLGEAEVAHHIRVKGETYHMRSLHNKWGEHSQSVKWLKENIDPNAKKVEKPNKHRYAYPLTKPMRYKLEELKQPYP